ncbi:MMPL family transporter [Geobacter pickeringii]|uniref:Transporter n=1 Tax=Geobacter pickeringii TaxID=345632 RepID=A0A0B5B7W4_9BACT|nr:MMPL family transporter [Geobacter pickeringii]AJE02658.1 transporter [Geobacter pickeringii]
MKTVHDTSRFSGLFRLVSRHPRLILGVSLLLAALSVLYTKQQMRFLTGRDDLMPKNAPFQRDYRANRAEFGDREDIVIVIESDDGDKASAFGEKLSTALAADTGRFRDVFYPNGLPFFRQHGLLLLPLDEIRILRRNLTLAKPVLKELATAPSVQTLFTHLTGRMDAYVAGGAAAPGGAEELAGLVFMLDKLGAGIGSFGGGKGSFSLEEVFLGGDSAMARAQRMQIVTVLPVRDAKSFVPAEEAIRVVRAAVAKLRALPEFKGVKVGLTGTPVLEHEEMATSERDITLATVLSLALTVVLLLVAFRGVLNVGAAMVSLVVAICVSFGMATLVVGHLNILSMVFAIMLIGIGIEYGIQVVLRYQEELGVGSGELEAIGTGLDRNLWAIVMAAATTAAAFFTFVFTDFRGIAELGVIAAIGIGVCVLVTFTTLPAALVLLVPLRRKKEEEREARAATVLRRSRPAGQLEAFLFGHPRTVVGVAIVLCAASVYPLIQTRFDYNLMNLQAKGLEPVEYAYKLMRSKENSGYFAEVTAATPAEAKALTARLEKLPAVDHVVSLLTFVPDDQEAKLKELAALRAELADVKPAPYEEDLRVMELPTVFENFRTSVERLKGFLEKEKKPEAKPVGAFLATLDRFFATLEKEKDKNALGMLRDFQGGMLASFPEKIGQLRESLAAAPVTEADIPPQLRERFVGKSGKYLLQVAPREEIFARDPLKRFLDQVRSVSPGANGEPVMVYESMTIMRDAYLRAFIYAFAAIVAILFITFRSVTYTLVGLVPLVVGLLLMVGGMWLCGISFNSANIIVMPLILGIAVDSGIYIINRFRREDGDPAAVIMSSTGLGVIYNTLTIMASFGALMVAHHQGVFSIGAVMSLGMVACQAAFVLVLPAVLSLVGKR